MILYTEISIVCMQIHSSFTIGYPAGLQVELEKQRSELEQAKLEIDGTLQNSSLSKSLVVPIHRKKPWAFLFSKKYIHIYGFCPVLQIILLQNQIWDLEQQKQGGDTTPQLEKRILGN